MQTRRLAVLVREHCATCLDAMDIAKILNESYPWLGVEFFNIDDRGSRDELFAVPTYMLEDRIVFL